VTLALVNVAFAGSSEGRSLTALCGGCETAGFGPEPSPGLWAQAAVSFHSAVPGSAKGTQWDSSSKETAIAVQLLWQALEEGAARAGISAPGLNPCRFYSFKRLFYCHSCTRACRSAARVGVHYPQYSLYWELTLLKSLGKQEIACSFALAKKKRFTQSFPILKGLQGRTRYSQF